MKGDAALQFGLTGVAAEPRRRKARSVSANWLRIGALAFNIAAWCLIVSGVLGLMRAFR